MKIILVLLVLFIIFEVPTCIGMGLIFKNIKLDFKKGIIPFYNKIILIDKYKLPAYHMTLIFIPIIGLYTNYLIYKRICKTYNKEFLYVLELTFFPFVYNIFLGLELKSTTQQSNYFEDQKEMYNQKETSEEPIKENKDEYIWKPKQTQESDTVYKVSRNNLNSKVNISLVKNNEIIDNKKTINKKEKANQKICPKCGTKVSENTEICFVCGTKL